MTDAGRKDISDKIQDKVTPDKSKNPTDRVGDTVTGSTDKFARDAVPDSQKSTSQAAADKVSRDRDANKGGDSIVDKAKAAVGMDKK